MAIEWSISDARPVGQLEIIRLTDQFAKRALPGALDLSAALEAAERKTSAYSDGTFEDQVYAEGLRFTALVDIIAAPMLGDDEQPMADGSIYGTVSARRTRTSAVLGFLVAVAWLSCAGGDLSGTGPAGYFGPEKVDDLLEVVNSPSGLTGTAAIQHASQRILGTTTTMTFS